MRKQKIYLETTLFNYYFDADRDAHADTVRLFRQIAEGKYEAYTSTYVTEELEIAPEPKRSQMLALIPEYGIRLLGPSEEARRLAEIYVAEGIIPQTHFEDSLHIAAATVNDLNMIVSLNFRHIVKQKTILATGKINILNGYHAIELNTPMEVIDHENA